MLNWTVSLKEEVAKKTIIMEEAEKIESRKVRVKADKEAKEIWLVILLDNLFKVALEYVWRYSKVNAYGLPTHQTKDVSKLMKSTMKKLMN